MIVLKTLITMIYQGFGRLIVGKGNRVVAHPLFVGRKLPRFDGPESGSRARSTLRLQQGTHQGIAREMYAFGAIDTTANQISKLVISPSFGTFIHKESLLNKRFIKPRTVTWQRIRGRSERCLVFGGSHKNENWSSATWN